jgi:hypothetical protein
MGWETSYWVIAAGILGYALFFFTNPVNRFFRDGLRCLHRYPRLWIWLSILGMSYALFQVLLEWEMGNLALSLNNLIYWPDFEPISWSVAAGRAWLSALELLAGLFNQAVVTYPLSAIGALLFIINWSGCQGYLLAASKRRLGRWSFAVYLAILLCALAAFCKPIFSISIFWLNQYWEGILLLRVGAIIDWLSFQFEYLFGLLIQIFLVLSVLVWIRGLSASPGRILELAMKRGVYAAKWAAIVLGLASVLIHLPLLVSYLWITEQTDLTHAVIQYVEQTARPLLAVILILFCSVELTLILHNETLAEAIGEHARLARRYWRRLLWFLSVTGLNLFAVCLLSEFLSGGFPKYSLPGLIIGIIFTATKGFLAAWYLASWVCLYRDSQEGKKEIRF